MVDDPGNVEMNRRLRRQPPLEPNDTDDQANDDDISEPPVDMNAILRRAAGRTPPTPAP